MSADMEDTRRIFAINIQLSMTQYGYPELVDLHETMMRERLLHDIEAAGYVPTGQESRGMEFVRYVKVQHHKHGWQMERRTATQETAEAVILRAELAADKASS